MEINQSLRCYTHSPYFIDLWFSQLNNGLSRLLEGCHFAAVCNEGLHDSWSGRQNDWAVQVGIELLLAET